MTTMHESLNKAVAAKTSLTPETLALTAQAAADLKAGKSAATSEAAKAVYEILTR